MATQTVPDFCHAMFTWIQQQGEALKRLPASADNAEAIIKAYEAMFRTTNSLLERMNIPETPLPAFAVPAAAAPIAPVATATATMRTVVSPREQIANQVARAIGGAAPRATVATARGAAKNGSLRAANRGVQKPAAAKKAALSLREYGYEMKKADRTKALRAAVNDRGTDVVAERLQFLKGVWGDNRIPKYLDHIIKDIEYVASYRGGAQGEPKSDSDSETDSETDSDSEAMS